MCTMRQALQQKITKNLRAIKIYIDAKDFIDIFIEKNVFGTSDQDEIMGVNQSTKENRNNCFIKKLLQKDDSAYTLFIDALKELGYQYLADLLENTKVDSPNQEAGVLNETASGKQDTKSDTRDTIGEKIRDVKTNDNKDDYSHVKEAGVLDIDSVIIDCSNTIISNTEAGVQELTAQAVRGKQDIESATMEGSDIITANTGVHELSAETVRGKQDIESVTMEGSDTIISNTEAGVHELSAQTVKGKQDIELVTMEGSDTIISNTEKGVHELSAQTVRWKQDIESVTMEGSDTIISNTEAGVYELSAQTLRGKQDIESVSIEGSDTMISTTEAGVHELSAQTVKGKQDIESATMEGSDTIISTTEAGVQELTAQTVRGKQDIESVTMEGSDTIISTTETGVYELSAQTVRWKQDIESVTMKGSDTIISNTEAGVYELSAETVRGKQDIESVTMEGSDTIISTTETGVYELSAQTVRGKQDIESVTMEGSDTIISNTEEGVYELSAQTVRGKQDIESVTMEGSDTILSNTEAGVYELTAQIVRGKQDIESVTMEGSDTIISTTEACVQELTAQSVRGKQDIESVTMEGSDTIISNTEAGVYELSAQTVKGKQDIESVTMEGSDTIISTTETCVQELTAQTVRGKQDIESVSIEGSDTIISTTETCVQELNVQLLRGKQDIESVRIDCSNTILSTTEAGVQELEAHKLKGKYDIESVTMDGINNIISTTEASKHELKEQIDDIRSDLKTVEEIVAQAKRGVGDFKTNGDEVDYSQRKEMLLSEMITLYEEKLTYVQTSALNDWVQAKLLDIYMPPNLTLMEKDKDKGFFKKTGTSIKKYSDIFLKDGTHIRNIFVQGEAGSGKSTILAIIVLDWIKISKLVELIQTDEANAADSDARIKPTNFFTDVTTLKAYTFVFHVTLRDSGNELNILDMIKKQIIDEICTDKDERKNAYQLLNKIMKRERCLILLDGLDERTCNDGLPKLAVSHSRCSVLITTRPWKMTEGKITDSMIDTLLQLEGVNEPFEVSRRLLSCREDCKDSKTLDTKQSEFESYINKNNLSKLLISPMLLQLIVHSWVEGTEINGSICKIYSFFLESLLKKANEKKRKFQSPRFQCFKDTEHIRPNIENVDRLAEAAFHLLFSNTRESSLVFSDTDLEQFELDEGERQDFGLKSGILSKTRNASEVRSSSAFSFIHKSIQEFLAAYYIACNTHLIDDIISGYLNRYEDAYMDISQVFIFLCGLEISAADKLSSMMNERNVDSCSMMNERDDQRYNEFSKIILSGFREAVANKHYDSKLKLSHFLFGIPVTEIGDVHNIWIQNTSNILSLILWIDDNFNVESQSSYERGESASHYEFDLSSCSKLKRLVLQGKDIWLKDSTCSSISEHPVWVVLNSADPLPALPCIERIELVEVTCYSRVLHSLFSSLLTLDHKVTCILHQCSITSSVQGSDTRTYVNMKVLNNTLEMDGTKGSPGLWEALHSLNIKSLSIRGCLGYTKSRARVWVKHGELLSQSLSSLTQLETLSIQVDEESPGLWEALHCLNIKSLTLERVWVRCWEMLSEALSSLTQLETLSIQVDEDSSGLGNDSLVKDGKLLSQSLSSLTQLETLSIQVSIDSPGLWKSLHSLNIKSLSLGSLNCVEHWELLSQSLSSLTQLETLSIQVSDDSPGLWKSLHSLNIKSLSLGSIYWVNHGELLSQSLSSLTQLETLSIQVSENSPGLLEALHSLHSLNIKSLSLGMGCLCVRVKHGELLNQSLSSLTQLETLTLHLHKYIVIQPSPSLKYLNIYCDTLLPSQIRELKDTLRACTQTIDSRLEFGCAMLTYGCFIEQIVPEEYIPIVQELETLENVAVKRFRILDRTGENNRFFFYTDADSCWSVRSNNDVDDDNQHGDNVVDELYKLFVCSLFTVDIIHRISMRLLITPASTSAVSNQYGCNT